MYVRVGKVADDDDGDDDDEAIDGVDDALGGLYRARA
jgi:hypothetical protein